MNKEPARQASAVRLTGNQLWKLRSVHGREKIFSDAAVLWDEAIKYFDWCDRHPWQRTELVKYQGMSEEADVPIGRPYSIDGLTVYLGVSGAYFRAAKASLRDKDDKGRASLIDLELIDCIERIESVVRTQQIEGASVGVFNANLISRINGLADNINQNNTGDSSVRITVRDQKTADAMEDLENLL